jgi:hypothetical protein
VFGAPPSEDAIGVVLCVLGRSTRRVV